MNRTCADCKHKTEWEEYGHGMWDCNTAGDHKITQALYLSAFELEMRGHGDAEEFLGMNCPRFAER